MLVDSIGRNITYLRLSVTDRCDLRCVYCMAKDMKFAPKAQILTLEELARLALIFVELGVKKIRITGGEPLVRRNVMSLFENLCSKVEELTLTTNGTLLKANAAALWQCGVRRVNVSLDTLDPVFFNRLSRGGNIQKTLEGIEAAKHAGLKVKINMMALKQNRDEIEKMLDWCKQNELSLTLIEVMPLGDVEEERICSFQSLEEIKQQLGAKHSLTPLAGKDDAGGPATYFEIDGVKMGFITPHTNNFCSGCNRVRVDCRGRLYPWLGSENYADLKYPLRFGNEELVISEIEKALSKKAKGHEFVLTEYAIKGGLKRHMNVTGG